MILSPTSILSSGGQSGDERNGQSERRVWGAGCEFRGAGCEVRVSGCGVSVSGKRLLTAVPFSVSSLSVMPALWQSAALMMWMCFSGWVDMRFCIVLFGWQYSIKSRRPTLASAPAANQLEI